MLEPLIIDAGGAAGILTLETDDLARLFKTSEEAVNIDSIKFTPLTLGTAVNVIVVADPDDWVAALANFLESNSEYFAATGYLRTSIGSKFKTFFDHDAATVAPTEPRQFKIFPVRNQLVIIWTADVDFMLEFEYQPLGVPWDYKEEWYNLLANKHSVLDPNLGLTQGKRQLTRAPLQNAYWLTP